MFEIKPYIYEKLRETGVEVTPSYPEAFNRLPLISFMEIDNSDKGICAREVLTKITIQIDVWSKGNTFEISKAVDEKMTELGFRRGSAQDMDTDVIKRKMMRFTAVINNRSNMLYQD